MRGELLRGRSVRPRRPDLDRDSRRIRLADGPADRHRDDLIEPEADLPAAGQLDIALGEKLGVDQRAMLDAQAAIDSEAGAERVEAVLGARVPGTRELERVDHPAEADQRPAAIVQLMVQKAEIEARVVSDERAIAEEADQILDDLVEARL